MSISYFLREDAKLDFLSIISILCLGEGRLPPPEIRATEVAPTHEGKVGCSFIYAKLSNCIIKTIVRWLARGNLNVTCDAPSPLGIPQVELTNTLPLSKDCPAMNRTIGFSKQDDLFHFWERGEKNEFID